MFRKHRDNSDAPTSRPPHMLRRRDAGPVTYVEMLPHEGLEAAESDGHIDELWTVLETVTQNAQKVLVITVARSLPSPRNLDLFWERMNALSAGDTSCGWGWFPTSPQSLALQREENAFRRFIHAVREMDTFVICVFQGDVVFPFLGLGLACDYRIVSADTVFLNRCLKAGLPACAALPWFLVRHLGCGKAAELLIKRERLDAAEAADLNLVDLVVASDDLETEVRTQAKAFADIPAAELVTMKRLLVSAGQDLDTYLSDEARWFKRWVSCQGKQSPGTG